MDYSNQLLYHPILALTKVSILLLYHRLSVSASFRIWVKALIAFNIALTVSIFVADLLQCTPLAFVWDKTIPGGKCMNQQAFFVGSAVLNIISDCAVLVLPIPMVWGMQTNTRKKIALIFLFSLGILYVFSLFTALQKNPKKLTSTRSVCGVSVVRLRAVLDLVDTSIKDPTCISRSDSLSLSFVLLLTWYPDTDSAGFMWSGVECSVAIVCASIPSLAPFFALHFPKLLGTTLQESRGKIYNYSGSRSEGYTLDSVRDSPDSKYPDVDTQPHVQTPTTKGLRRENESEESIIPAVVKTTDV